MVAQGVYLWVGMSMLGPKGIVGHANGAWGDTEGRCDRGLGQPVQAKRWQKTYQSGR